MKNRYFFVLMETDMKRNSKRFWGVIREYISMLIEIESHGEYQKYKKWLIEINIMGKFFKSIVREFCF